MDYHRSVAVSDIRCSERLAIVADLHDFVAHHMTGILVQTQMARMMAATQPRELDPVLAGIERAATEAVASMRRTVGEPGGGVERLLLIGERRERDFGDLRVGDPAFLLGVSDGGGIHDRRPGILADGGDGLADFPPDRDGKGEACTGPCGRVDGARTPPNNRASPP